MMYMFHAGNLFWVRSMAGQEDVATVLATVADRSGGLQVQ